MQNQGSKVSVSVFKLQGVAARTGSKNGALKGVARTEGNIIKYMGYENTEENTWDGKV